MCDAITDESTERFALFMSLQFKQRGYTDSALDRRTATTTGQMLYQIVDPRPAQIDFTDNLPPTPPAPSVVAANRRREVCQMSFQFLTRSG